MMGFDKAEILRIPREGAPDAETKARLNKVLGVPDKPEGYGQFQPATGALALSAQEMAGLDKVMHEAGAPPAARNAALKYYHEATAAAEKAVDDAYTAQVNEGLSKLKAEWGAEYEARLQAGHAASKAVFGDEFSAMLKEMRVDDHPIVKRAMFALAKAVSEDGRVTLNAPTTPGETPDEAQRKIAAIQTDKAFMEAFNDPSHMDHANKVAEWKRLHDRAFGA